MKANLVRKDLVRAVRPLVGIRPGQSAQALVAREAHISQSVLSKWLRLQNGVQKVSALQTVRTERHGACVETVT
jgi:hypothetical protein